MTFKITVIDLGKGKGFLANKRGDKITRKV
uniref:ORF12 n=1 Tax=Nitrosopumilaceae spindle-shaped virus TaxID=3065433 RepID=A0AAT9J9V7_9VIRU